MTRYTTTQAAKALGLSPVGDEVMRLIRRGELPATKEGRRYMIEADDVEAAALARSGARSASEQLQRILLLEAEVEQLRQALGGPSTPASRQRIAVIRSEFELEYGQRKRGHLSNRVRWLILERDGHRCTYCGVTPAHGAKLTIDHRIPVIDGGTDDPDNLTTACEDCNWGKADRPLFG